MELGHVVNGIRAPGSQTGFEIVRRYVGHRGDTVPQHEETREEIDPFDADQEDLIEQVLDVGRRFEESELGRELANIARRMIATGNSWVAEMKNVTRRLLQNVSESNVVHRIVECLVFVKACLESAVQAGLRYSRDILHFLGTAIDQCVQGIGGWKTIAALVVGFAAGFVIVGPVAGIAMGLAAGGVRGICGVVTTKNGAKQSPAVSYHRYKKE